MSMYGSLEIWGGEWWCKEAHEHQGQCVGLKFHIDGKLSTTQRFKVRDQTLEEKLYGGPCDLYIKIRKQHSSLITTYK
jgi:hypothetical protein